MYNTTYNSTVVNCVQFLILSIVTIIFVIMITIVIFITTGELQSSKRLELNNVYTLLKGKHADWNTIGRALGVSLDKRKSLEQNGSYDSRRLEEVLYIWLETSEQSKVTWEEFIRVMKDEEYNDVVNKTEELLRSLQ